MSARARTDAPLCTAQRSYAEFRISVLLFKFFCI
jgi:hypothetical protein